MVLPQKLAGSRKYVARVPRVGGIAPGSLVQSPIEDARIPRPFFTMDSPTLSAITALPRRRCSPGQDCRLHRQRRTARHAVLQPIGNQNRWNRQVARRRMRYAQGSCSLALRIRVLTYRHGRTCLVLDSTSCGVRLNVCYLQRSGNQLILTSVDVWMLNIADAHHAAGKRTHNPESNIEGGAGRGIAHTAAGIHVSLVAACSWRRSRDGRTSSSRAESGE